MLSAAAAGGNGCDDAVMPATTHLGSGSAGEQQHDRVGQPRKAAQNAQTLRMRPTIGSDFELRYGYNTVQRVAHDGTQTSSETTRRHSMYFGPQLVQESNRCWLAAGVAPRQLNDHRERDEPDGRRRAR